MYATRYTGFITDTETPEININAVQTSTELSEPTNEENRIPRQANFSKQPEKFKPQPPSLQNGINENRLHDMKSEILSEY